jgi:inosose dehydratase
MKDRGIASSEQYLAIRCDEEGPLEGSEAESTQTINQAAGAGVQMLVIAVDGSADRDHCAGRADTGPQLSDQGFKRLADQVQVTALAAAVMGNKLFDLMDPNLVGMCLDVGHWIVGGGDPIAAVTRYGSRITHLHVKDVNPEVLNKLLLRKIETMSSAVEDYKLFVPAGTGSLKLPALFQALNSISYVGWLMSEQDSAWEPREAASGISMSNIKSALE